MEEKYIVLHAFSNGRDGTVLRLAKCKTTEVHVALKCIPLPTNKPATRDMVRKEAEIMRTRLPRHTNILHCMDFFEGEYEAIIVLEFCEDGDLLDLVNDHGKYTEDEARIMFVSITTGLLEMHKNNIAHRDIKLENILIRGDDTLVVADFGFARRYAPGEHFRSPCGTLTYAAPELHEHYSKMRVDPEAADVFALGVVLYALISAHLPFNGTTDEEVVNNIRSGKYDMPKDISHSLRHLLQSMLAVNAKQRPSLRSILSHAWVTGAAHDTHTNNTTGKLQEPSPVSIPARNLSNSILYASAAAAAATHKTEQHRSDSNNVFTMLCKSVASLVV